MVCSGKEEMNESKTSRILKIINLIKGKLNWPKMKPKIVPFDEALGIDGEAIPIVQENIDQNAINNTTQIKGKINWPKRKPKIVPFEEALRIDEPGEAIHHIIQEDIDQNACQQLPTLLASARVTNDTWVTFVLVWK